MQPRSFPDDSGGGPLTELPTLPSFKAAKPSESSSGAMFNVQIVPVDSGAASRTQDGAISVTDAESTDDLVTLEELIADARSVLSLCIH